MKLTAIIFPDSETGLLVAECPEIGAASQGHTEAEALANWQEATGLYLESFPHAVRKPASIHTFELAHGQTARRFRHGGGEGMETTRILR